MSFDQDLFQSGHLDLADTAFLLFDAALLGSRLDRLRRCFPKETQHAVAIKTNPHPAVLRDIVDRGFALEAASWEELQLAAAAGAPADRLVFDSPAKTQWEIAQCAQEFPGMVLNANSLEELNRVPRDSGLRLGLRINPLVASGADPLYDVSAARSKFGVPIEAADAIVEACVAHGVEGLHLHVSSGNRDGAAHRVALDRILDLADRVDAALRSAGCPGLTFLDLGGGLSADAGDQGMAEWGQAVARSLADRPWQVWTEFGHWVHRDVGAVFSRIEYLHPGHGGHPDRAVLHVGADLMVRHVYHHARPLACQVLSPEGVPRTGPEVPLDLVGPLCFAGDVLAESVMLPAPMEGDWLRIDGMGANTYALWSRHCSRTIPKVLLHDGKGGFRLGSPRRAIGF